MPTCSRTRRSSSPGRTTPWPIWRPLWRGDRTTPGYPTFNAPDSLASDLRAAGFDLLSTANNHSLDRGTRGVYRTLDVLDQEGLAHAGTYRSQEERDASSGVYVADVGGRLGGLPVLHLRAQTASACPRGRSTPSTFFNLDYYTTLSDPDYDRLQADLEAARALDADLIAVIIHWGVEYQNAPNTYQTNMARFLVEQGADLVLGSHPHVLQPYETISVTGWDGRERQGFVCYSLGNFISNQQDLETRTTAVLELELTRDPGTGETSLTHVSYLPYYMVHRNGQPAGQQRYLVNIHQAPGRPGGGRPPSHRRRDTGAPGGPGALSRHSGGGGRQGRRRAEMGGGRKNRWFRSDMEKKSPGEHSALSGAFKDVFWFGGILLRVLDSFWSPAGG